MIAGDRATPPEGGGGGAAWAGLRVSTEGERFSGDLASFSGNSGVAARH